MDVANLGDKMKTILVEKSFRSLVKDSSVFICCPFHGEREPSCSVNLHNPNLSPGTFHCFGCGEKGGWNKLADALKVDFKINEKDMAATLRASIKYDNSNPLLIETGSVDDFVKSLNFDAYTDWPVGMRWRRIKYEFLKLVDARMIYEFDEQKLFLPVKVNNKLVGGIRASIEYKKYLTTTGNWVKDRGLFPFDVTKEMMDNPKWKKKFVVLVEGPRDVARLISVGIPALAILGSRQWSSRKTDLLLSINDDDFEVLTMFDADHGGKVARELVESNIRDLIKVRTVTMPKLSLENGEWVATDVFNLSRDHLRKFCARLKRTYR